MYHVFGKHFFDWQTIGTPPLLVNLRGSFRRHNIELVKPGRAINRVWPTSSNLRAHNPRNCVNISLITTAPQEESPQAAYCSSLLLSNVMLLVPKIDKLRLVARNSNLDCICITETWLQSHVSDNIIALERFNLVRRDRYERIHGGVCTFIRNDINFFVLDDLADIFEALWIHLQPNRLPRGFSCIIIGTIYHPPNADNMLC
jgi:hypothetical protein